MASEVDLHLGRRLKRRRRILGLTQQQLAQLVGVRFQQIQKYECGGNRISADRLWQLAGALEVPVEHFYFGLNQPGVPLNDEELPRKERAQLIQLYEGLDPDTREKLVALMKSLDTEAAAA